METLKNLIVSIVRFVQISVTIQSGSDKHINHRNIDQEKCHKFISIDCDDKFSSRYGL